MSEALLQFVSIVPKASPLGQRLDELTPVDLEWLRSEFERRFSIEVTIDERDDEPEVHDFLWLNFPHFEITFRVLRLDLIRQFEQFAFETGTPQPEK
jgi:hypothetical protein